MYLLWEEYIAFHKNGYSYSQFCILYKKHIGYAKPIMRFTHKAGEKMFVDFAGMTMPVVDRQTGEITEAEIFVAALGAS
ncbi:MAG: transposase, partial [Actinobacteria bacterium]|nr:transposase [Actinomycetota bacterium]